MTTEIQILGASYVNLSLCLSSWHSFDYSQDLLNIRGLSDAYEILFLMPSPISISSNLGCPYRNQARAKDSTPWSAGSMVPVVSNLYGKKATEIC
jgi:hypothetical protein